MPGATALTPILIVDDDTGLLRLMERALKREGFATATASSGKDAIAWLARNTAALMLLDLKLQDIEGMALVNQLGSIGRSVPYIIITGQGDERVAVEMMKRGALDYLVKDMDFVEFVPTVVRRALAQLERERRLADAENRSRESAERYQLLVEMAGTVVFVLGKDGAILEWSGTAERVYGYTTAEVLGKNYLKLFLNEAERPGMAKELEKVFAGIPTIGYENPVVTRSGAAPTFLWNATLLRKSNGEPVGALSVGHDITERKRLEKALLEISEREQRKFGHDMHDGLGQRLTGLEMLSNVLAEDLKAHSAGLARQARRLNKELRETVTQARLISHSLAPVPLEGDGLMQGLSELAAGTSRIPGVRCRFLCDPPVHIADQAVATHLYRIAQEAVNNALKHGPARRIEIALSERQDGLEMSVKNDGSAMPASNQRTGGMGLNVMRYRAGIIGASLSLESDKGKGVRVTCTLRKKA